MPRPTQPGSAPSASASASASAYPPLSPKELVRAAEMFEWRPQIPLKFHIGSLDVMLREGKTYLAERNYAKAYVLLLRYSIICMDKVPTHPEAATSDGRKLIRTATRRLKTVLRLLESIKQYLVETRNAWLADHGGVASGPEDASTASLGSEEADAVFAARDPALSWNPHSQAQLLDASEHVNLAVELANTRRAGDQHQTRPPRHAAPDPGSSKTEDDDSTSREMELARWQLEEMARRPSDDSYDDGKPDPVPVTYNYPRIQRSTPVQYESMQFDHPSAYASGSASRSAAPAQPPQRPALPPKQPTSAGAPARPPPVPSRGEPLASRYSDDLLSLHRQRLDAPPPAYSPPDGPPPPPKTREAPEPAAAVQTKKSQYTFKPAAYLENGAPIRSVFLPETLRHDFLLIAQPNTTLGIETCGILCGKTANNALFITCLLIPQQTGTADSCETMGEVETLEYCSAEDLIQIGWIHTHPTQTCFMSSLDMHTHAGYQMMMDESIAIVCAPRFEPHWGIFRLTNPPGLPFIGSCRSEGAFHEHALRPHEIYTDAKNPPGHVFEVSGMDYNVADLRTG